jgi:hypothetical protein
MNNLLIFFEVKHNFTDVINYDIKIEYNVIKQTSITYSPMLQMFFKTVLEYYYINDIPLDYTDSSHTSVQKSNIIKKVNEFSIIYEAKASKMFDLLDFMFKVFKKFLKKCKKGFQKWLKISSEQKIDFDIIFFNNLDICLYLLFSNVFPEKLKDSLRLKLSISDLDDKILKKCYGTIIKNNFKVCNIKHNIQIKDTQDTQKINQNKIDDVQTKNIGILDKLNILSIKSPESITEYKLSTYQGITTLLIILRTVRPLTKTDF